MPPKTQFSKEKILDTALNIAKEWGISTLTVRKLAMEMGCSVAPVYVNFENSEELIQAVMDKIRKLSWEYSTRSYTEIGFFNIGIGQILFVKDFPQLYLDLLNHDNDCLNIPESASEQMVDIMMRDKMLEGLTRQQNRDLLLKMSLFTNGLSITMTKVPHSLPFEKALRLLEETAHQLVHSLKNNYHKSFLPCRIINLP